jgi:hypothetical protein
MKFVRMRISVDMHNAKNASDTEVLELPSGRHPSQGIQIRSDYALH